MSRLARPPRVAAFPAALACAATLACTATPAFAVTQASAATPRAEPASRVTEVELVQAFLAREAADQRSALSNARREAAGLARFSRVSWRVEALREESTSSATASRRREAQDGSVYAASSS